MTRPFPFPDVAGIEPSLSEILQDPTFHLLLGRDGIEIADVQETIHRWQSRRLNAAITTDTAA